MKRALWWVPFVLTPALAGDAPAPVRYEAGVAVAQLENQAIDESSGLVAGGPANPGIFFTHNDSGDAARFFAFDTSGKHRGVWTLAGVQAVDWEEMTAWTDAEGQRWLMLCDTGDNARRRDHLLLHVVREPKVGPEPAAEQIAVERSIKLRYPDAPHDVESVAAAPREGKLYLVVKDRGEGTLVFTIPLSPEVDEVVAEGPLTKLGLPMTTAMDMAPDERRLTILTYTDAHQWTRAEGETWADAFRRASQPIPLPRLHQREALCYGPDGVTLYVTSEKLPTPLVELRPIEDPAPAPSPSPSATPTPSPSPEPKPAPSPRYF